MAVLVDRGGQEQREKKREAERIGPVVQNVSMNSASVCGGDTGPLWHWGSGPLVCVCVCVCVLPVHGHSMCLELLSSVLRECCLHERVRIMYWPSLFTHTGIWPLRLTHSFLLPTCFLPLWPLEYICPLYVFVSVVLLGTLCLCVCSSVGYFVFVVLLVTLCLWCKLECSGFCWCVSLCL